MSFLAKIGHGIKVVVVGIAHGFISLFGAQTAHDFASATVAMLRSELGQLALHAVLVLADLANMSGEQKRAHAFSAILQEAEQRGLKVAESTINLLIELAVTAIKQKFDVQELGVVDAAPAILPPPINP
jgi:hypothetical protein